MQTSPFGAQLPDIKTAVPGPKSKAAVTTLAKTECPAITARRARRKSESGVDQDPIVWKRAKANNIEDVDGNIYVDFTSAFAVCGLGHTPDVVVQAMTEQARDLIHAMGDVYPSDAKVELSQLLADVTPGDLQHSILGLSGSDAIGSALKTAAIYSGKPGVIAFSGSYHGLNYGALPATGYKREFRAPFISQINPHVTFHPYPDLLRDQFGEPWENKTPEEIAKLSLDSVRFQLEHPAAGGESIGAIIVEPIQGRGGEVVPPATFLPGLRALAEEFNVVLIFDEIFTGFMRTGVPFASQHPDLGGVVPDLLCLGKGMGGGFPISAVVGRPKIMEAWGNSKGEAIHTQTFLGNPLGSRMAIAAISALLSDETKALVDHCSKYIQHKIQWVTERHQDLIFARRGKGLMLGLDLTYPNSTEPSPKLAMQLTDDLRRRGYLVLPSGIYGNVLSITPPFTMTDDLVDDFFVELDALLTENKSKGRRGE